MARSVEGEVERMQNTSYVWITIRWTRHWGIVRKSASASVAEYATAELKR
jgi:hypothetical protein